MFKVLFMPLLQIPSGHHHVADSIKEQLHQSSGRYYCEKLEILSHCYGKVEAFISTVYLQWIHKLPQIYSRIYKTAAVKGSSKRYYTYEWLFLKKVHRAIEHTNPDLIICTHALPSYLLERLKKNGLWSGPVINVYTDYFINDLWGREHIDYHFVPSLDVKQKLLMRGANRSQIFVTGIPVHPIFKRTKNKSKNEDRLIILISGGNMGAGAIQQLLNRLKPSGSILYKVLCGKNDLLFQSIERLQYSHIKALPYLDSKGEMNQLYDEAV